MSERSLPNGDVVESGDVILFEGYPYRVEIDDRIVLSPVFWGDSELDLVYEDVDGLAAQWGEESEGTMSESEWEQWLAEARADDRFGEEELDAVADVVLPSPGVLDRLRRLFGRSTGGD